MRTVPSLLHGLCVAALAALVMSCSPQPESGVATTGPRVSATPAEPASPAKGTGPGQGEPCDAGACADGLTCVEYFGIAGPQGPTFTSCEFPCQGPGSRCPDGQVCTTVADGPGEVCRPRPAH